jgi:hypothetical protein
MMDNRRMPRQPANWAGLYRLGGESAGRRRACEIVDISKLGLGVTFHCRRPSELIGRAISVEIPAAGDTLNLCLKGEIKNAAALSGGSGMTRVGLEFAQLSATEEALLAAVVGVMNEALVSN